jgi:hypothetical protein
MARLDDLRAVMEGRVVHQDRAQQRLLGLKIVRQLTRFGHDTIRRRAVAAATTSAIGALSCA